MNLTARQIQIVKTLYSRNRPLADGTDDQRRQLVMLIAQQVAFEYGSTWGTKRADPGRPLSKDAIAHTPLGGTLLAWDLFNGATRVPFDNPSSIDISSQVFVTVTPVDHLKDTTVPVPPPVEPVVDYQTQIDGLGKAVEALALQLFAMETRFANPILTERAGVGFLAHSHKVNL
jgi:hypothetical protein